MSDTPATADADPRADAIVLRRLWLTLPVLLVLACWAGWSIPLNNDVAWQYWVARQIRGGAILYRDVVEVNPPLWFWEAVPISALADRLRIDASHLVVVSVMIRIALAVMLSAALLRGEGRRRLPALLLGAALLLGLLPLHEFAERDPLMLIGALPYVVLTAARRDALRPVSPWLAGAVGLFAAYGFAMKPHFVLVPLALETWLVIGLRRQWRPLRPETGALAVAAMLYGVAVLLFAPDYVRLVLPLVRAAYGAFAPPFSNLFTRQIFTPTWLLCGLALASGRRDFPTQGRAATVAAAAMLAVYLVQGKGFLYHALPATAMLGWALLWLVRPRGAPARRPLAIVALAAIVATGWLMGRYQPVRAGRATAALERMPAGSIVAVISAHSWLAFPLVETRRFVWPMRGLCLWTLPQIARTPADHLSQGIDLRWQTLDTVAQDLWCHPPDALLIDDPERSPALRGLHFSYEAFVRSDPRLRDLLGHYRPVVRDGNTTVYRRIGALLPSGVGCRTILVRPDWR